MIDINYIRENKEIAIERLSKRAQNATDLLDELLSIDSDRKTKQQERDELLAEANKMAKEIGILFKQGNKDEAEGLRSKSGELKEASKSKEIAVQELELQLQDKLYHIPNLPHDKVPSGRTEEDNEIVGSVGDIPELELKEPHWEITKRYDLIDFELGNKVTGAGFPVYKGKGAILQRALIQFFLNEAGKEGYLEIQPPILINEASGYGTGQLPDKEGQMYHVGVDDLYLIPTGEVPLTNIYRDVMIDESEFPIKLAGHTPCFRREAGSYGKDVRGLNRLHQFDKVEIVQIEHPEKSYETLENMRSYVEGLLKKLGLPYRVLRLCAGDLGFTSALTYDMEVFSAGQDRWLEVSSVSNFESYQANRLKLRYKDANKKKHLAHTLNGSALALPRIMASILENYNTKEGVIVPEVLRAYTSFDIIN